MAKAILELSKMPKSCRECRRESQRRYKKKCKERLSLEFGIREITE